MDRRLLMWRPFFMTAGPRKAPRLGLPISDPVYLLEVHGVYLFYSAQEVGRPYSSQWKCLRLLNCFGLIYSNMSGTFIFKKLHIIFELNIIDHLGNTNPLRKREGKDDAPSVSFYSISFFPCVLRVQLILLFVCVETFQTHLFLFSLTHLWSHSVLWIAILSSSSSLSISLQECRTVGTDHPTAYANRNQRNSFCVPSLEILIAIYASKITSAYAWAEEAHPGNEAEPSNAIKAPWWSSNDIAVLCPAITDACR